MKSLVALFLSFSLVLQSLAVVRLTNGSDTDVNAKIALSSSADVVVVPAGTFTWGAAQTQVNVNKPIYLLFLPGATIQLSATGPYYGSGVINITANGARMIGGTILGITNTNGGANGSSTTPLSIANCNGWRVTGTTYTGPASSGYFAYVAASNGLFDHVTINGNSGQLQTFMIRGATAVWSAPNTMGSGNAVFIEDCTVGGTGYTNENDGAAQSVIRFNKITSSAYVDAHMIETAQDASGVAHGSRQIEAYDNTFLQAADYYNAFNLSGGTFMIFDNVVANDGGSNGTFALVEEYGAHAPSATYPQSLPTMWTTPAMSPIADQVGMGPYPQVRGAEPGYYFNNAHVNGNNLALTGSSVAAGALTQFGSTFWMTSPDGSPNMLLRRLDYFRGDVGGTFPSTTDVGRGTRSQMLASSPTIAGQGWWVTDEGNWNRKAAANHSGQLYRWNGTAWALYYTPYPYPHPLQDAVIGNGAAGTSTVAGAAKIN